jgi:outer membrane protein TolC
MDDQTAEGVDVNRRVYMIAVVVTGLLIFLPGSGTAGRVMTLDLCLEQGIENNTTLKAALFDIQSAAHDIKAARAAFLPSLSTGFSSTDLISENAKGPTETDFLDQKYRQFNIKLSQILYNGQRLVNTYNKAKVRKKVIEAETLMHLLEQVYKIEITFYRLMKAKQDVIAGLESVENLMESVKAAESFFKQELVPYVDVLQARVDLADAREKLGIAKNNVNRERVALFTLMNLPEDPSIEFSGDLSPVNPDIPDFDVTLANALDKRPDIESLTLQVDMAEKDADIAMGKYLPSVRLDAGYNDADRDYDEMGVSGGVTYDRDQRNRYWSAGVYVSWELFDGGRAWYQKERYKTQAQKINVLIDEAKNTISSGIRQALLSMAEANQRTQAALEALEAAEEYYALEERRLEAGLSTIPDFLDAQSRLVRARGNHAQAILDFRLAESELKLMTGKPPALDLSKLDLPALGLE